MPVPFPLRAAVPAADGRTAGYPAALASSLAQQRNGQWVRLPRCSPGPSVPSPLPPSHKGSALSVWPSGDLWQPWRKDDGIVPTPHPTPGGTVPQAGPGSPAEA